MITGRRRLVPVRTDTVDVFGSFTMTVSGRNTHAVNRGLSLGISWSFGQGGGEPLIAARQRSLVRCLCEKSGS